VDWEVNEQLQITHKLAVPMQLVTDMTSNRHIVTRTCYCGKMKLD